MQSLNKLSYGTSIKRLQRQLIVHKVREGDAPIRPQKDKNDHYHSIIIDTATQKRMKDRDLVLNDNFKHLHLKFDIAQEPTLQTTQEFLSAYYKPILERMSQESAMKNDISEGNHPPDSRKKRLNRRKDSIFMRMSQVMPGKVQVKRFFDPDPIEEERKRKQLLVQKNIEEFMKKKGLAEKSRQLDSKHHSLPLVNVTLKPVPSYTKQQRKIKQLVQGRDQGPSGPYQVKARNVITKCFSELEQLHRFQNNVQRQSNKLQRNYHKLYQTMQDLEDTDFPADNKYAY